MKALNPWSPCRFKSIRVYFNSFSSRFTGPVRLRLWLFEVNLIVTGLTLKISLALTHKSSPSLNKSGPIQQNSARL